MSRFKKLKVGFAVWRNGWKERQAPTVQSLALCVHSSSVYLQKKWQDIFIFFVSIPAFHKLVCLFFSPDSSQPEMRFSCCIRKGSNDVFCVFLASAAKFSLCCDKKLC